MDRYEIEFTMTKKDLKAFTTYLTEHPEEGRKRRPTSFKTIFVRVFIVILSVTFIYRNDFDGGVIFFGVAAIVLCFFWRPILTWLFQVRYEEAVNTRSLKILKCIIEPGFVSWQTALCQTIVQWEGIERIGETADYLFLFTSRNQALPIPHRAFSDPIDFDCCCRDVKKWQAVPRNDPQDTAIQSLS